MPLTHFLSSKIQTIVAKTKDYKEKYPWMLESYLVPPLMLAEKELAILLLISPMEVLSCNNTISHNS